MRTVALCLLMALALPTASAVTCWTGSYMRMQTTNQDLGLIGTGTATGNTCYVWIAALTVNGVTSTLIAMNTGGAPPAQSGYGAWESKTCTCDHCNSVKGACGSGGINCLDWACATNSNCNGLTGGQFFDDRWTCAEEPEEPQACRSHDDCAGGEFCRKNGDCSSRDQCCDIRGNNASPEEFPVGDVCPMNCCTGQENCNDDEWCAKDNQCHYGYLCCSNFCGSNSFSGSGYAGNGGGINTVVDGNGDPNGELCQNFNIEDPMADGTMRDCRDRACSGDGTTMNDAARLPAGRFLAAMGVVGALFI